MNDEDMITHLWYLRDVMSDCGISWVNQLLENRKFDEGRSILKSGEEAYQGIAYFSKEKVFAFWNSEYFSPFTEKNPIILTIPFEKIYDMDFVQQCANILKAYEERK